MGGDDLGSDDEFIASAGPPRKKPKTSGGDLKGEHHGAVQQRTASGETDGGNKDRLLNIQACRRLGFLEPPEQLAAAIQTAIDEYTSLLDNTKCSTHVRPSYFKSSHKELLLERLKDVVSTKAMKNWNHKGSPCVVVVCLSARRATEILKDLAPLKIRMAKLFPKSGSVEEQLQLLSNPFGVAVGTPHRVRVLAETSEASLLSKTQLFVFDSQLSHKAYNVFTLPDTAPDCARLLVEHLLPQFQTRKDLKLAFL